MPGDTAASKKSDHGTARNRKGRRGPSQAPRTSEKARATEPEQPKPQPSAPSGILPGTEDEEGDVCHICAETMDKKAYAVAECNHRTCYTCALRLRALYKRLDCTFCKKPQPIVIVTSSSDQLFESYTPSDTPFHDTKLSMDFETSDMMEDCLLLLRFNCPDVNCEHVAVGWPELKHHTKTVHDLFLCDLCIRHKKIFAHEHTLYTSQQLAVHLPIPRGFSKKSQASTSTVEIDSHPVCEFCHEALYGEDEQFSHMRQRHEECFVCKAAGIRHQYFQHYNSLERHFHDAHYPCPHSDCLTQKFVVFSTAIDLQGHVVEKHGETMSTRDLRDARRIQAEFAPSEQTANRGRPPRSTERRNGASHAAGPQREAPTPPADLSAHARRRLAFSSNLSADQPQAPALPATVPVEIFSLPLLPEATTEQVQRHNAFMSRVAEATHDSPNAAPALKSAIRSYRSSESNARALVDTFFIILNQDLDTTGTFISSLVDLLDDEEKKSGLLSTWKTYKIEHRQQFPSLTPAGAQNYAGITSGRAIQVKRLQSGRGGRTRVWDRVAQAASSAPGPLPMPRTTRTTATLSTAGNFSSNATPWSPSAAVGSSSNQPRPTRPGNTKPPAPSSSAFPSLPPSQTTRPPKEFISGQSSLRAIVGSAPSTNVWSPDDQPSAALGDDGQDSMQPGRRKKVAKQTLFTLGSYR